MNKQLFKDAMRHLTATVNVVTTKGEAGVNGITATAVTSLSDTPPSLLISVNKKSDFHQQVVKNKKFSVHILQEEMAEISNCFAGYKGLHGEEKFTVGHWESNENYFSLKGALATIDCVLKEDFDGYTHSIFIGEMINVEIHENEYEKPLLYGHGQYTTIK